MKTFQNSRAFVLLILLVAASLIVSCRKIESTSQNTIVYKTIKVDEMNRRYALYIPRNLGNQPVPLVIELGGGHVKIEDMTGQKAHKSPHKLWMNLADSEKFIVVYVEGLDGEKGRPTWNDCREDFVLNSGADDVKFISNLIDEMTVNYKIDTNRIYASGPSNGGMMSLRLVMELSHKIAAVASVIGAMPVYSECKVPTNPISVLFMNGSNDNYVPYEGGIIGDPPNPNHGKVLSTEASVKYWVDFNQTRVIPQIHTFPDLDKKDGGNVIKYTYSNGLQGTEVVLFQVNGGGHSAPSIKEQYSNLFEVFFNKQNHDIEMSTEIWKFFKDKTLR